MKITANGRRMLAVIRRNPGFRAGAAGYELWHQPGHQCKPENNQATMFCRQAGKILRQLRLQGLVNCRQDGPALKWTCTAAGLQELEKEPKT